ncbi:clostripain-related cysteine peptidase [Hathewaya histolytica]|uniref:clostripain-related cysteine peptidase n=1 Tax=Hathewaya histolytica TaxID=1498 RepID=UPI003B67D09D
MKNKRFKKWTILIYADGNNDMEDIMFKSMNDCKSVEVKEDINLVMQIGLLGESKLYNKNKFSGVRRYYLNALEPMLLENLGKINMGDSNILYNFIRWGIKEFPAHHYMVIISGHGTNFVGGLTDTSLNKNYIMGIPEMIRAISLGCKKLKSIIDILVLDMCFMNSIEILYELSQYESINRMITYTDTAPYDGLAYKKLVEAIEKNCNLKDIDLFTKNLITNLNFNLTAYDLDKLKLELIKKKFSYLAFNYLNNKERSKYPLDIINSIHPSNPYYSFNNTYYDYFNEINNTIKSTIIHDKSKFNGINSSIKIENKDISNLIAFYRKLEFSKENYWTDLLYNNSNTQKRDINKVKVKTPTSSLTTTHYILQFNPN